MPGYSVRSLFVLGLSVCSLSQLSAADSGLDWDRSTPVTDTITTSSPLPSSSASAPAISSSHHGQGSSSKAPEGTDKHTPSATSAISIPVNGESGTRLVPATVLETHGSQTSTFAFYTSGDTPLCSPTAGPDMAEPSCICKVNGGYYTMPTHSVGDDLCFYMISQTAATSTRPASSSSPITPTPTPTVSVISIPVNGESGTSLVSATTLVIQGSKTSSIYKYVNGDTPVCTPTAGPDMPEPSCICSAFGKYRTFSTWQSGDDICNYYAVRTLFPLTTSTTSTTSTPTSTLSVVSIPVNAESGTGLEHVTKIVKQGSQTSSFVKYTDGGIPVCTPTTRPDMDEQECICSVSSNSYTLSTWPVGDDLCGYQFVGTVTHSSLPPQTSAPTST